MKLKYFVVSLILNFLFQFLENVGYCPQFDAINEVLSAREMLYLFAKLRGLSENIDEEVDYWLNALGELIVFFLVKRHVFFAM